MRSSMLSAIAVFRHQYGSAGLESTFKLQLALFIPQFRFKVFYFFLHACDEPNTIAISSQFFSEFFYLELIGSNDDFFTLQLLLHPLDFTDVDTADVPHLSVKLFFTIYSNILGLYLRLEALLKFGHSSLKIIVFTSQFAHFFHQFDIGLQVLIGLVFPVNIVVVVFIGEPGFSRWVDAAEVLQYLPAWGFVLGAGFFKLKESLFAVAFASDLVNHCLLAVLYSTTKHVNDVDLAVHFTVLVFPLFWQNLGESQRFLE